MKHQRGVALSGLIFWGIVLTLIAVLGMKVAPSVMEYLKVQKNSKATINQVGREATVADVRKSFDKFAEIDQMEINSSDLEISKEGGQIVISFAYEKRIHLFRNVYLLIEYAGSTAE